MMSGYRSSSPCCSPALVRLFLCVQQECFVYFTRRGDAWLIEKKCICHDKTTCFEARRASRAECQAEDDKAGQEQDAGQDSSDEEQDGLEGRADAPSDREGGWDAEDGEQDRGVFWFDMASKSNRIWSEAELASYQYSIKFKSEKHQDHK